jgi:DNA polymerase-3 subunit delta
VGTDPHLADSALAKALARAGGDPEAFRGDETDWGRIVAACRTGSLFAERRAVVVRNAEGVRGEGDDLLGYLDSPNPAVTLILLAVKPDRRKTFWKTVLEASEVLSADPPKGRALRAHILDRVRERGLLASPDALEEIVERVGSELGRLEGELDKLEAFAAGKKLSAEDVTAVMGRGAAPPLYVLGDAFTARRLPEVLDLVGRLLSEGEAPLRILATLHRSLRQVRGAMALREARASRETFASSLGVPPFKVGDLIEASRGWSEIRFKKALEALWAADRRLKTSGEPRVTLTEAAVLACGPGAGDGC